MGSTDILPPSVPQEGPEAPIEEGSSRVCLFSLCGEFFVIGLHHVLEFFQIETITRVARVPSSVFGVTNLRGLIIPLVDLRVILDLPVTHRTPGYGVVIRHGTQQMGLLVDQVPEIMTVQKAQFLPVPIDETKELKPFITDVLQLEDRLGGVIEVSTLLAYVEAGGDPAP